MKKNHFLLLKKLKNTESAQLCNPAQSNLPSLSKQANSPPIHFSILRDTEKLDEPYIFLAIFPLKRSMSRGVTSGIKALNWS